MFSLLCTELGQFSVLCRDLTNVYLFVRADCSLSFATWGMINAAFKTSTELVIHLSLSLSDVLVNNTKKKI
jgi:hypothetical protein